MAEKGEVRHGEFINVALVHKFGTSGGMFTTHPSSQSRGLGHLDEGGGRWRGVGGEEITGFMDGDSWYLLYLNAAS